MEIRLHVVAGAKKELLTEARGAYRIMVKEKAEGNRANERVRQLLALHFAVSPRAVRFVSGHHAPTKRIEVLGR